MLENINNNMAGAVGNSQSLDRISEIGFSTNPFSKTDDTYFVDESYISNDAIQKYQKDMDIKYFSKVLMESDEKEANSLVIKKAFDGMISIEDEESISNLLNNSGLLNDIIE